MAVHKLSLEDFFEEEPYALFGIHCTIDDYRLAYLINRYLDIGLKRKTKDLDFRSNQSYAIFEWDDEKMQSSWNLVSNICRLEVEDESQAVSLFSAQTKVVKPFYLVPEYKKVNYILKVKGLSESTKEKLLLDKIQKIPQVVTAYSLDSDKIKLKHHLIFD